MTMQHHTHPDDERLSALAGGDPEASGDPSLRAHVDGCERCTSLIRDLGELRLALAQLPDIPPSRPLQLVPPVAVGAAAGGGWLRRLAAPVMAAGAAMAVIGAVGFGAVAFSGMAASGGAPAFQEDAAGDAPEAAASEHPDLRGQSGSGSPRALVSLVPQDSPIPYRSPIVAPADEGDEAGDQLALTEVNFSEPGPWLAILAAGVALLLLGLTLRVAISPRAG